MFERKIELPVKGKSCYLGKKHGFDVYSCPYCLALCEADWVDVEVGWVQCGPFHCTKCKASEIGTYDTQRLLTQKEKDTGWYGPGQPYGDSANTIDGELVGYKEAEFIYRIASVSPDLFPEYWSRVNRPDPNQK